MSIIKGVPSISQQALIQLSCSLFLSNDRKLFSKFSLPKPNYATFCTQFIYLFSPVSPDRDLRKELLVQETPKTHFLRSVPKPCHVYYYFKAFSSEEKILFVFCMYYYLKVGNCRKIKKNVRQLE